MLSPLYDPLQLGHTAQDVGAQGEPLQGVPRRHVHAEPVDDVPQVDQQPVLADEMFVASEMSPSNFLPEGHSHQG